MEWASMEKADMVAQLAEHPQFLKMRHFKTKRKYHIVGKGLFEGTVKALLAFGQLPTVDGKPSKLFFPGTPDAHKATWKSKERQKDQKEKDWLSEVSVHKCLETATKRYLDGFPLLSPTILRKVVHTKIRNQEGNSDIDWSLMCALDTHTENMYVIHASLLLDRCLFSN